MIADAIVLQNLPQTVQVASIGIPDTLFLMLLALVVFGPRRLPEIGRQIGKLMYEFRKVSNDFKFQMEEELRVSEESERLEKLRAIAPTHPTPTQPLLEGTLDGTSEATPVLGLEAGATLVEPSYSAPAEESLVASEAGEVRGEPRKFPPIMPPSTGETIAAQKPFRGRVPEPEVAAEAETHPGPESDPQPEVEPEYENVQVHLLGDPIAEAKAEKEQGVHHG